MNSQQSEQFLSYLKNTRLLEKYCLSIHPLRADPAPGKVNRHLCGIRGIPHLCHKICLPSVNNAVEDAMTGMKPVFSRCPLGILFCAIPFSADSCLMCGGARESLFDLYLFGSEKFKAMKGRENIDPFELLEQLEKFPVTTDEEFRETIYKAERLAASFTSGESVLSVDIGNQLQNTFGDIAEAIRNTESFDRAIALFSETLGILFNVPVIALVRRDKEHTCWLVETCWGLFSGPSYLAGQMLFFQEKNYVPVFLNGDKLRSLFPGTTAVKAICLPLTDRSEFFGMVVLFDVSFNNHELAFAELIASKLVEKLKETIVNLEIHRQQRIVRLLEMIRILVVTESQNDLLHLIMEMSAELVDATKGSLMIIDKKKNVLHVVSALGMHLLVARNLSNSMGEGIAGRVAASGTPLLINDIEQEAEVGRQSWIRFASRSCISLPLRFKSKTIGVLNLADKNNNSPFTIADQDILSSFIEQATIILERTTVLKKARLDTVTDSLTNLYNVRFIKKRLNEELSRSLRHDLNVTLMIVSLDNFASYNKAHGQTHGNEVVKKMARIFDSLLRDIDLAGRASETKFFLILPETPAKDALVAAKRIECMVIKELGSGNDDPHFEAVTTSIGIASFPENGDSPDEIIDAASTALTKATTVCGSKICLATK